MKTGQIQSMIEGFEAKVHRQDDIEFWYARDLQKLLGYTEWRNFVTVIEKAKESCENANHKAIDHFVDVNKMVGINNDAILLHPPRRVKQRRDRFAALAKTNAPKARLCDERVFSPGLDPGDEAILVGRIFNKPALKSVILAKARAGNQRLNNRRVSV